MRLTNKISLNRPVNKEWDEIEKGYNSLLNLANRLNKKIKQLAAKSNYELDKHINKEVIKLIRKFEKNHAKWKEKSNEMLGKPKVDIPKGYNIELSFTHYMDVLFLMMSKTDMVYNNILSEYRTVDSNVKVRFTKLISSISISLAILSIVLALVLN